MRGLRDVVLGELLLASGTTVRAEVGVTTVAPTRPARGALHVVDCPVFRIGKRYGVPARHSRNRDEARAATGTEQYSHTLNLTSSLLYGGTLIPRSPERQCTVTLPAASDSAPLCSPAGKADAPEGDIVSDAPAAAVRLEHLVGSVICQSPFPGRSGGDSFPGVTVSGWGSRARRVCGIP